MPSVPTTTRRGEREIGEKRFIAFNVEPSVRDNALVEEGRGRERDAKGPGERDPHDPLSLHEGCVAQNAFGEGQP